MSIKTWAENISKRQKEGSLSVFYNRSSKKLKVLMILVVLILAFIFGGPIGLIVSTLIVAYYIYRSRK